MKRDREYWLEKARTEAAALESDQTESYIAEMARLWNVLLFCAEQAGHGVADGGAESEFDFLQRLVRRP